MPNRSALRVLAPAALYALSLAPAALAQTQPVDIYWSDRWNGLYHEFSDLDGDGTFLGDGEVRVHVEPGEPGTDRAAPKRATIANGERVHYWLYETGDQIIRGVDVNGDGRLLGVAEVTVFRDSGALDGDSIPWALDITDDGAVWWVSSFLLSQPLNGISRLEDLNGDGDAADAGEHIQYVDFNAPHPVETDLGPTEMVGWETIQIAAAGNGVITYAGSGEDAVFRFEDLNQDGDVRDAGESVLLLNASGEEANLPQNPDFADGTLPNINTQAGWPARFGYLATAMENGVRAYYFGLDVSPFNASGTSVTGKGLNWLIFRGVDLNGDRDVNDAGEVKLHFDGSYTDGDPDLLVLRGMDVLDGGTLYAVGLKPYPVLGPGDNGNTWIHRLEDLNGDGDAMDAGEQTYNVFNLQAFGYGPVFPTPPPYGNVMADPWDFSVFRVSSFTDMGGASTGSVGTPTLSGTGTLVAGTTVGLDVTDAPAGALMLSWLSFSATPTAAIGGTLFAFPFSSQLLWAADGSGQLSLSTTWPAGLPVGTDAWIQFVVQDGGVPDGITLSNALKLTTP